MNKKEKRTLEEKLRTVIRTCNELEKNTLLRIINGLTNNKTDKVSVKNIKYPLINMKFRYIMVPTDFGIFNVFVRRKFSGKSGTHLKPDFLIFKDRIPEKREDPQPDAIIECKGGREDIRNFIFQLLVYVFDLMPKIAILVIKDPPQKLIETASGYEGILSFYGIKMYIYNKEDESGLAQLIFNGIVSKLTSNRLYNNHD